MSQVESGPQLYPKGIHDGTFDMSDCTYEVISKLYDELIRAGQFPSYDELQQEIKKRLLEVCHGEDTETVYRLFLSNKWQDKLRREWLKRLNKAIITPQQRNVPRVLRVHKEPPPMMLESMSKSEDEDQKYEEDDDELMDMMSGDEWEEDAIGCTVDKYGYCFTRALIKTHQ